MYLPKIMSVIFFAGLSGAIALAQTSNEDKKALGTIVVRGSIDRAGETKTHQMKMIVNRFYEITIEPKKYSELVQVTITDDNGHIVGHGLGNGKAVVEYSPVANGIYDVKVFGSDRHAVGTYLVTIRTRKEIVKRAPVTVRGVLSDNSPKLPSGKPFRRYHVMFQAGRTYTIELNAKYDTYLYLKSLGGRIVSRNDDGGPGLNSKIIYRATTTGVYRIYSTTFGTRKGGTFTLSVR